MKNLLLSVYPRSRRVWLISDRHNDAYDMLFRTENEEGDNNPSEGGAIHHKH